MPATVPACWGSRWRSRLMRGRAREMLVRSMKAMVYMTSATGMMRVQRAAAALAAGGTLLRSTVCEVGSLDAVCASRATGMMRVQRAAAALAAGATFVRSTVCEVASIDEVCAGRAVIAAPNGRGGWYHDWNCRIFGGSEGSGRIPRTRRSGLVGTTICVITGDTRCPEG